MLVDGMLFSALDLTHEQLRLLSYRNEKQWKICTSGFANMELILEIVRIVWMPVRDFWFPEMMWWGSWGKKKVD